MELNDDLKVTVKDTHLEVVFSGEFGVAAGKATIDAMAKACAEASLTRVLFDYRPMRGEMKIFDRLEVGLYATQVFDHGIKIAMLGREDQRLPDNFVENVGVNRGLQLRIFTDSDEATTWLTQ